MKTALVITLIAGTGVAFAQPKDSKPAPKDPPKDAPKPVPPAAPTPAKELDLLKAWTKGWTCTGTNMGEKTSAKLTFKRELDSFWYSIKFEAPKTKAMGAFTGMAMFGVDPVSKGWVVSGFDNHGGSITMKAKITDGTPAGTASAMTWEGDANDVRGKMPAKFTFTADKKSLKFVGDFAGKTAFDYDCK